MSRLKPYLIGAAIGAAGMFFTLQYHVVRSEEGWFLVPRTPQHEVALAFADIRKWDEARWQERPELARALVANGSKDLISSSLAASANAPSEDAFSVDTLRETMGANAPASGENADSLLEPFTEYTGSESGARSAREASAVFQEQRTTSADLPPLPIGRDAGSISLRETDGSGGQLRETRESTEEADRDLIDSLFDSAHLDSSQSTGGQGQGFSNITNRVANRLSPTADRTRPALADPLDDVAGTFNDSVDSLSDRLTNGLGTASDSAGQFRRSASDHEAWNRTSDRPFDTATPEPELTPELRALRDRFDPFAD